MSSPGPLPAPPTLAHAPTCPQRHADSYCFHCHTISSVANVFCHALMHRNYLQAQNETSTPPTPSQTDRSGMIQQCVGGGFQKGKRTSQPVQGYVNIHRKERLAFRKILRLRHGSTAGNRRGASCGCVTARTNTNTQADKMRQSLRAH